MATQIKSSAVFYTSIASFVLLIFPNSILLSNEELEQSKTAQELQCFYQMTRLWCGASSYCLENGLSASNTINTISLEAYVKGGKMSLVCPLGDTIYPSFDVSHGPTCPNGHKIENNERVIEFLKTGCKYGAIMAASEDASATMRRCSILFLTRFLKENPEEIKNRLTVLMSDNDPVVRALTINALKEIKELWVKNLLMTATKDVDPFIRTLATDALSGRACQK